MSVINQAYFDRVRYILQNDNLGSLIIEEPIGWDSDDKELSRHKDYHGIFPKFSNNLKFKGQAKDYLQTLYDIYGVNAQVRAMDSQCQVLGSAQQGWHGEKRQTWGHTAATNSRGQLLDIIQEDGAHLITVPFDLQEQQQIRESMPLMQHRRLIQFG